MLWEWFSLLVWGVWARFGISFIMKFPRFKKSRIHRVDPRIPNPTIQTQQVTRWFHWGTALKFPMTTNKTGGKTSGKSYLGGDLDQTFFIFIPNLGEMIQFHEHIFQMGWFNHQLVSRWLIFFQMWGPQFLCQK